MEQLNQVSDNCTNCGKSKTVSAGQSLTQWIFSDETCRCDIQFATNPNVCRFCGKALTKGTFETMTQWIFHPDVCSCGVDNQNFLASIQDATAGQVFSDATTKDTVPLSPRAAFIYELENNKVDYHGLPPESFPFERFRIIEEVGRGAAGVVYQAWDCLLKRRVAIKTMHATAMSAEEVIRLQNEARTSSRLKHPAIVRILDFGAAPSGQPYLVSDFIDGTTLQNRLEETGPLSGEETVRIFTQLCAGIMHAHEQKVLHRDLKSSNVLISNDISDGTNIKIIDFGVASLKEAMFKTSAKVETSTLVGTPYYMSPEQAAGKRFDARSEVYSIGCMMFEALTGQTPFRGETALETLAMHSRDPVPALEDVNPDLDCSERLESIVLRCLEKDPANRIQSVHDLHEHLSSIKTPGIDAQKESGLATGQNFEEGESKPQKSVVKPLAVAASVLVLVGLMAWCISVLLVTSAEDDKTAKLQAELKLKEDDKDHMAERDSNYKFFDGPLFDKKKRWDKFSEGNWVGSMWLTDKDFAELQSVEPLKWVESPLSSDVTGDGLKYIKNKQVQIVHLHSKNLSDAALENISEMKSLRWVTLGSAHNLSADKFQLLTRLPQLGTLKLQDVVHPPNVLETLAADKQFVALILMDQPSDCGKTNWAPLARMSGLRMLDILKYDFTNSDLEYIRPLKRLDELRLVDIALSDFDAGKIIYSPIRILDLSFNRITDKTLASLESIKSLEKLDLTGCSRVTADGIKRLKSKLKRCEILQSAKKEPDRDAWSVANIAARGRKLEDDAN